MPSWLQNFRMSGSRWVTISPWLSGSLKPFLYSFSVYSWHPLKSLLPLLGPYHFCLYHAHPCMKISLESLIFLKQSLVFPFLLFSSISLHWSLRKALSLLAIVWNSAFKCAYLYFSPLPFTSLLFTAICKTSSDNHLPFAFLSLGDGLDHCLLYNVTNLCPSKALQALYQIKSLESISHFHYIILRDLI